MYIEVDNHFQCILTRLRYNFIVLDLIIIGAGPAGIYAAYLAGLRQLKTVVLESLANVGGQLQTYYPEKPIYDIPATKSIQASTFIEQLKAQYQTFEQEVPIHTKSKVQTIVKTDKGYQVTTTSGKVFETQTILLCSGAGSLTPRKLEGIEDERILYAIDNPKAYQGKNVAVLGGGDSALDWANELALAGAQVTLIHRRDEFRALETMVSKFTLRGQMKVPYEITSIENNDLTLTLHLKNNVDQSTFTWQGDYLLVCYGFVADTGLLNSWGIDTFQGKAKVNSNMECSLSNVFGVGNAVTYEGKAHTIASAFGEVNTAIESIHHRLRPGKKLMYSSFLKISN